jgi:hypothetical protein
MQKLQSLIICPTNKKQMEENTKADDETLKNSINNEPEKPSDEIIPSEKLDDIIPKQQTENMETHAHHLHKAPGNKFWHFFFEFLMLFLAVFCGFLAENLREHYVENQRAEELAKNLYSEILADSININKIIALRKIKENECTYFISYVKDSSLTTLSDRFYPAFSWALILQTSHILFEPNDGILDQLRNSGELRYFRSSELQAAVGKLSVAIANIRSRHDKEYSMVEVYLRPFTLKFYDFNWYESLCQHGSLDLYSALNQKVKAKVQGKIPNLDKFNRKEAENLASYYLLILRGTRIAQYTEYATINHQLLQILRKEYHLE